MSPVRVENPFGESQPPFETSELRSALKSFLDREVDDPLLGRLKIGNYKFGAYAFFDYDMEPIYVGQTNEMIRTRIRRHLTNQRTDAVAMNVLDPFEVFEVRVWPLPQFQNVASGNPEAKQALDALEYRVFEQQLNASRFHAVLNEKEPPPPIVEVVIPEPHCGRVVTDDVLALRQHPDVRIARRALVLSRLAQVISERVVQPGLRKTLLTQAKRLEWLADARRTALGTTPQIGHAEEE